MTAIDEAVNTAAEWIQDANALVITAGAGMGVDSGLPDFRGSEGLWEAYPPLAKLGLDFSVMANPRWFQHDPRLAWGFYGHRLELYREHKPHLGYRILHDWCASREHAVFTSNVDGHFAAAGFDPERICEVHGSIHHFQCTRPCCSAIWRADHYRPQIDPETLNESGVLPRCGACDALARPNILMFGDANWVSDRSHEQEQRHERWLHRMHRRQLVVIECGAGTAVPTVRMDGEWIAREHQARLIRINLRDTQVGDGELALPMGAKDALQAIDEAMMRFF
ncbi:MAG: NAD-dependent protein deacetylase [Planctomycetota bacterium]|jgi:NAD-dependent SIR2 family protein deacetylase|nr:NAD-dependent protein deacetylase [Planctomycetota bacterium]